MKCAAEEAITRRMICDCTSVWTRRGLWTWLRSAGLPGRWMLSGILRPISFIRLKKAAKLQRSNPLQEFEGPELVTCSVVVNISRKEGSSPIAPQGQDDNSSALSLTGIFCAADRHDAEPCGEHDEGDPEDVGSEQMHNLHPGGGE